MAGPPPTWSSHACQEAEAMVETLTSRAARRSRIRARLVRFALNRARSLAGLRELPKYNLIVAIGAVRRQTRERRRDAGGTGTARSCGRRVLRRSR